MRLVAFVLLHFAALAASVAPALAAGKVALVVGNADYAAAGKLDNPLNDTRIVGNALRGSGFEVIAVADAKLPQFRAALRDFRGRALGADVAVVYFAGHGIEANGRNWLIPVDAQLESDFDLVDEAIDLDRVMEALDGAKVRVVVLDACRNNPFGRNWGSGRRTVTRGLAPVEADDVLVIYAAAPGQFAFDGDGANSPFALSMAARLVEPGLPLQLLGGSVRDDVLAATGGKQRPFVSASMTGTPIYLVQRPAGVAVAVQVPPSDLAPTPNVAALMAECVRLAGDTMMRTEVLPALAIPACQRAVRVSPGNARVLGFLGFAYDAAEDFATAREWYEEAAAKGNSGAMNNLGYLYSDGRGLAQDHAAARRWFEQAAAANNSSAMHNLGFVYDEGRGVAQDHAAARAWFERAAANGLNSSMYSLGVHYLEGRGGVQDYVKARKWFEEAAANGHLGAMTYLGHFYFFGSGVAKDYSKSKKWYEEAAARGEVVAMISLGSLYHEGKGMAQDHVRARNWYEQAAAKGNDEAAKWLAKNPK